MEVYFFNGCSVLEAQAISIDAKRIKVFILGISFEEIQKPWDGFAYLHWQQNT
jgi:hypothetical protein